MTTEEQEKALWALIENGISKFLDDFFKQTTQGSNSPLFDILKGDKCSFVLPDDWASRSPKFKSPKSLPSLKGVASLSDNKPSK